MAAGTPRKSTPVPASPRAGASKGASEPVVSGKGKGVDRRETSRDSTGSADGSAYRVGSPIRFQEDEPNKASSPAAVSPVLFPMPAPARQLVRHARPTKARTTKFRTLLLRIALLYVGLAYFYVCPHDGGRTADGSVLSREYRVCSALDIVSANATPLLTPYYTTYVAPTLAHTIMPLYETRVAPVVDSVRPLVRKALVLSRPLVARISRSYQSAIAPHLVKAGNEATALIHAYTARWGKGFERVLRPTFEWYSREILGWYAVNLEPHVSTARSTVEHALARSNQVVTPVLDKALPWISTQLYSRLLPLSKSTLANSKHVYETILVPRLVQSYVLLCELVAERLVPAAISSWETYGEPQVVKILEKIGEYRNGTKSPVAALKKADIESPTVVDAPEPESEVVVQPITIAPAVVVPAKVVPLVVEPVADESVKDSEAPVEQVKVEEVEIKPVRAEEQIRPVKVEEVAKAEEPTVTPAVEGVVEEQVDELPIREEDLENVARVEIIELEIVDGVEVKTREKVIVVEDVDDLDAFIAELREEEGLTGETEGTLDLPPAAVDEGPSPEEQLAQTAAKRLELETLRDTYEKEIARLGHEQHDLLLNELIEIKGTALKESEERFKKVLERVDEEGDKMLGRLTKYFERLASPASAGKSDEDKIIESNYLALKAVGKVRGKMLAESLAEVEQFRQELEQQEIMAVERASTTVKTLVSTAQEQLGFGWTWLDDVTHADWQRFHKLGKAESSWTQSYIGLQTGAIQEDVLGAYADTIELELERVQGELLAMVDSFEGILERIKIKGQESFKAPEATFEAPAEEAQVETEEIEVEPVVEEDLVAEETEAEAEAEATETTEAFDVAHEASPVEEALAPAPAAAATVEEDVPADAALASDPIPEAIPELGEAREAVPHTEL